MESDHQNYSTPLPLTDLGNAERLVAQHGDDIRYCHPWKKWLDWDSRRWSIDVTGAIYRRAASTVRSLYGEAAGLVQQAAQEADERKRDELNEIAQSLLKWAKASENRNKIENMVALARSRPGVPATPEQFDQDHWLLNCGNGTLDLRSGKLMETSRNDYITKLCPVDYTADAPCPRWQLFLERVMPKPRVRGYLQRGVGYSLTGDVSEDLLFILWGSGRNGKSVFLDTLMNVFGDYAHKCPPELLMSKRNDNHPTERTVLFGIRFAPAIETGEGRKLDESLVKELTGGDKVVARRMREDFWEFSPTHHLWLATNHKPIVQGTDLGIWSRLRLIPFTVTIPAKERDKSLRGRLTQELPGILSWAVQGCLDWQKDGLREPPEVLEMTTRYRDEMDVLGDFLSACCVEGLDMESPGKALYQTYQEWSRESGERIISARAFNSRLRERGFRDRRGTKGATVWTGLGLLGNFDEAE